MKHSADDNAYGIVFHFLSRKTGTYININSQIVYRKLCWGADLGFLERGFICIKALLTLPHFS